MVIDDIRVIINEGFFSPEDTAYYVEKLKKTTKFTLKKVVLSKTEEYLDIRCAFKEIPFERLYRVPMKRNDDRRAVNH